MISIVGTKITVNRIKPELKGDLSKLSRGSLIAINVARQILKFGLEFAPR